MLTRHWQVPGMSTGECTAPQAKVLMTNSGKYAHYAPGLSNRSTRFGSLAHCAATAQSGTAPTAPPAWIAATPG